MVHSQTVSKKPKKNIIMNIIATAITAKGTEIKLALSQLRFFVIQPDVTTQAENMHAGFATLYSVAGAGATFYDAQGKRISKGNLALALQ